MFNFLFIGNDILHLMIDVLFALMGVFIYTLLFWIKLGVYGYGVLLYNFPATIKSSSLMYTHILVGILTLNKIKQKQVWKS